MSFEIAKAGWVHRLSTVIRRWKRNWLVLYQDGSLKYFTSTDSPTAEDAARLPAQCQVIHEGGQVVGDPPSGYGRSCMFSVSLSTGATWTFCAESPDDMKAWSLALNEAHQMDPHVPPGPARHHHHQEVFYPGGYPGHVIAYPGQPHYGTHPPAYVLPENQTIMYVDQPYPRRRRDCNDGLLGGMMLGGLMWGPLLWW